ncbi:MAG TPA: right-handed parallel beta-helix repeat-containing protein [Sphingobium sp.]|uniref:right-handed parallel beta-helix repeat-containing protein n=1 Tax=Sphingobium sp. TaxID=1912891 RepID=UPI002ED3D94F
MRFLLMSASLLCVSASVAVAQSGRAPFTVAETGAGYAHLQQAVDAIGSGTATIDIAPGQYRECAVQNGGSIRYRAETPGTAVFSGGICEDKAALVLHGRSARVEGIVFEKMAVSEGNGAGIRLETGDLVIDNSVFRNSQQGLLTASYPQGSVTITRSTFSRLGTCDYGGGCAHSVYIGDYGSLTINHSRFEAGTGGHYVKSRAPHVRIVDNSFDDSRGHATNYMIDLSNGATGQISGNEMVQGKDKDNYSAFIALAAEGKENSSNGLTISGNGAHFVPGVQRSSALLADWTHDRVALGSNDIAAGITARVQR